MKAKTSNLDATAAANVGQTKIPLLGDTTTVDKTHVGLVKGSEAFNPNKTVPVLVSTKCDPLRSKLDGLEERIKHIRKFEKPEPGEKPHVSEQWAAAASLVADARFKLQACEASLIPKPPPVPPTPTSLTLTLTNFVCLDQSDDIRVFGFNVEDDEPYALVFAVDLTANPAVGASNSKMTLIGPLLDVDPGDRSAPANTIWGLSGAPDLVTSANNLIILVAMMENDSSSPDQARTVLENAARVAMTTNLPAFGLKQIPRQELVNRIITGMVGAMGLAKVGAPDPDDNIGAIQELRFFQFELDDIYKDLGPKEKSLTFEGDAAKYILKFKMFR